METILMTLALLFIGTCLILGMLTVESQRKEIKRMNKLIDDLFEEIFRLKTLIK